MTTMSRVLAGVVAVLVLLRVVSSSVASLTGPTMLVVAVPTLVLLLAALVLVVTALLYAGTGSSIGWFRTTLIGFLVVMAAYLALGFAIGAHVPWTAYAVLAGVAVLGGAALAPARERD